jgi:hypothetical protein
MAASLFELGQRQVARFDLLRVSRGHVEPEQNG